ncbi:MAG TPA: hypothetical protein VEV19_08750 [Ktedonobacteraceae bacterium]|nr:hypothetical protein [Ktedonobacteraceae bacterium]
MNILIVGGLLIVGIAAILGAVFLAVSDQRKETARANSVKLDSDARSSIPPVPSAPTVPVVPPVQNEPVPPQSARATSATRPIRPSTSKSSLVLDSRQDEGIEKLPALNGQFHELANEIRSLHQQAWQLEQRLSVLTEMVDHVERSQGHYSVEESEEEEQNAHIPSENTIP